ncbi:hypothetical protein PC120_g23204 [Phytophthora cactorum]|nr:hypothetical protein PC120_g23204 [Phytophthora cactorum]
MENALEIFKTNTTPAQATRLFIAPKDAIRTWSENYMYLVAISEACRGCANDLVLNIIVHKQKYSTLRPIMGTGTGQTLEPGT